MKMRMTFFIALLAITASACAAFYAAHCQITKSNNDPAKSAIFIPQIPDYPPLTIMEESSGQVYNIVKRDQQNNKILSIQVGYRDGRRGEYIFADGKLQSYKGYDKEQQLCFEAEYSDNGLIRSSRYLRADGSPETLYRRLLDGTEEVRFLDRGGKCIRSVLTAGDGSQTSSSYAPDGQPSQTTFIKAETREECFFPLQAANGKKGWRLSVKLTGARVCSWEYRDKNGNLRHRGVFTPENKLEITMLNEQEQPILKQIWTQIGEDWSRRFYKLAELQKLNADGSRSTSITLYPDGVTPKEVSHYYDGQKNSTESYDSRGFMYHQEYFDSNGFPNGGWDPPPQSRSAAKIDPALLAEPSDNGMKLYRLKGSPYSEPLPAEASLLCPLFMQTQ